jgi:hypothetical protein
VLEKTQCKLIDELSGGSNSRGGDRKFRRAGTAKRTMMTRDDKIEFKLVEARSLEDGSILRPFLLYVGVEPRRRIVDDLVLECAEAATHLTYRDS